MKNLYSIIPGWDEKIIREKKLNRLLDTDYENDDNFIIDELDVVLSIDRDKAQSLISYMSENMIDYTLSKHIEQELLGLYRKIYQKTFPKNTKNNKELVDINNKKEFMGLLKNSNSDIIVNALVASYIQDFADNTSSFNINTPTGILYEISSIYNNKIYVDPVMRWDDTNIYVIKEPFFYIDDNLIIKTINSPNIIDRTKLTCKYFIRKGYSKYIDGYHLNYNVEI